MANRSSNRRPTFGVRGHGRCLVTCLAIEYKRAMNEMAQRPLSHMTADEFLLWPGDASGRRFQLVDGEVRSMSPASRIHGAIQANLAYLLVGAARVSSVALQVITEGAIIPALTAGDNVRVPDLVVAQGGDVRGDQTVADPLLILEILSPGNTAATRDNVRAYATLSSVREIVVVHTSRIEAEVYRREPTGQWPANAILVERGGQLHLRSIGLICSIDDVYANTWMTRSIPSN